MKWANWVAISTSMAERLESMVKAQQRLLGDISHELRSPLARLGVALGLARQRSGAEANGALDRIERESDNLNEMISQLLTLTRLESGTDGRKRTDVDLAALVREVAEDADFEARSTNRAVQVVSSDNCSIKGVEELLRSAVENVVRNAVRYTPEGTAVEVALRRQNGHAVISVRDRGKAFRKKRSKRSFVRSIAPKMRVTGRVVVARALGWRSPNAQCGCTGIRRRSKCCRWRLSQSRCDSI